MGEKFDKCKKMAAESLSEALDNSIERERFRKVRPYIMITIECLKKHNVYEEDIVDDIVDYYGIDIKLAYSLLDDYKIRKRKLSNREN